MCETEKAPEGAFSVFIHLIFIASMVPETLFLIGSEKKYNKTYVGANLKINNRNSNGRQNLLTLYYD
ncbi:MAG TPA: hypothetical protein DF409_00625 [Bacteroidales bacterium]|nr:hypothetical protein [Bacteroidales bacterium]